MIGKGWHKASWKKKYTEVALKLVVKVSAMAKILNDYKQGDLSFLSVKWARIH